MDTSGHKISRRGTGTAAAALIVLMCALWVVQAPAQDLGGIARVDPGVVQLRSDPRQITLELPLSQPVPWRVRVLGSPPRLVVDLNTVDWSGLRGDDLSADAGPGVAALRVGRLSSGWARLVADMTGPYRLEHAQLRSDPASGRSVLALRLERAAPNQFDAHTVSDAQFTAAYGADLLHPAVQGAQNAPSPPRALVVMLDPGHGGIDPGAERNGLREADLMLGFARELREALMRADGFEVVMTRDADVFVSLDGRIRAARTAGADVLLSLHADALPDGIAAGTTLYVLSEAASDSSAEILAERHDRADLLAGVDLTRAEDAIADVLMSLARTETKPRTDALTDALLSAMTDAGLRLHRRPRQSGAFSVLRAPDIPSVLIELGFMSSPRDLANLQDPAWRSRMITAIFAALDDWARQDAAAATLRRR